MDPASNPLEFLNNVGLFGTLRLLSAFLLHQGSQHLEQKAQHIAANLFHRELLPPQQPDKVFTAHNQSRKQSSTNRNQTIPPSRPSADDTRTVQQRPFNQPESGQRSDLHEERTEAVPWFRELQRTHAKAGSYPNQSLEEVAFATPLREPHPLPPGSAPETRDLRSQEAKAAPSEPTPSTPRSLEAPRQAKRQPTSDTAASPSSPKAGQELDLQVKPPQTHNPSPENHSPNSPQRLIDQPSATQRDVKKQPSTPAPEEPQKIASTPPSVTPDETSSHTEAQPPVDSLSTPRNRAAADFPHALLATPPRTLQTLRQPAPDAPRPLRQATPLDTESTWPALAARPSQPDDPPWPVPSFFQQSGPVRPYTEPDLTSSTPHTQSDCSPIWPELPPTRIPSQPDRTCERARHAARTADEQRGIF